MLTAAPVPLPLLLLRWLPASCCWCVQHLAHNQTAVQQQQQQAAYTQHTYTDLSGARHYQYCWPCVVPEAAAAMFCLPWVVPTAD